MKTILIIEDDQEIIDTLRFVLMDTGYVVNSSSKAASVTLIEDLKPDLILLDDDLNNASGSDLCMAIKAHAPISFIPIVFISSDPNIVAVTAHCGADSFIKKPLDVDEIIYLIDQFFRPQGGNS